MEQNQEIKVVNKDDRTWAMLCHLSALAGFIVPFGSVLGPLIIWLINHKYFGKYALKVRISAVRDRSNLHGDGRQQADAVRAEADEERRQRREVADGCGAQGLVHLCRDAVSQG